MSKFTVEKDWITKAGFRAVVILGKRGSRCGYVGLPKEHRLYGASYSEPHPALSFPSDEPVGKRGIISLICASKESASPDIVFDVHGSLTYSGGGDKYPVKSNLWWFGYDCSHSGDAPSEEYCDSQRKKYPDKPFMWSGQDGVHRTLEYCESECESLAQQMIDRVMQHESMP